jgi:hypothetical protein
MPVRIVSADSVPGRVAPRAPPRTHTLLAARGLTSERVAAGAPSRTKALSARAAHEGPEAQEFAADLFRACANSTRQSAHQFACDGRSRQSPSLSAPQFRRFDIASSFAALPFALREARSRSAGSRFQLATSVCKGALLQRDPASTGLSFNKIQPLETKAARQNPPARQ